MLPYPSVLGQFVHSPPSPLQAAFLSKYGFKAESSGSVKVRLSTLIQGTPEELEKKEKRTRRKMAKDAVTVRKRLEGCISSLLLLFSNSCCTHTHTNDLPSSH